MQKKRHLLSFMVAMAAFAVAPEAPAIGWVLAQQPQAVLGAPLDFNAALRIDPGDDINPQCVTAEVMAGDQRLPSFAFRLLVDASNPELLAIRVVSSNGIDEPVVAVTLAIGCPARLSRRFVLLADPPSLAAAAPPPPAAMELPALRTASAPPAAESPAATATAAPAPAPAPRAESRPAAPASVAPRKPRRAPVVAAAASRPAESGPRLRLDAADVPPASTSAAAAAASAVEDAIQVVAQAASAARAAASAASAAEERVATLERQVAQLRGDADASRDLVSQMRIRLANAEGAGRWTTPLLIAIALLAALAAWLAWRLRSVQQERLRSWRTAAAAAGSAARPATPTSQLPMVTSEIMAPPPYPTRPAVMAPPAPVHAPPSSEPESANERTLVLPPRGSDDSTARDVSIEELLDLEQQAEFFIVLGQDEAAIDLLVDHLRDTGGGSPLPYLKLLEIYRRRDDRDAYERTRTRFNHRFNAYAPDWDTDLQHGRSLDDYAGVVPRLQQIWSRPLDAMAELEALLFRKSRGQLFDLPAYREVLFLYSLARDLLDREAADNGNIDLLLPLADGGEFSATSPHPYLTEGDSVFDKAAVEERPTAPIDLDLSQSDEPSAIVKPLAPRG